MSVSELVPGIWSSERSLWFSGVKLRSRMTVVRLDDGALWVHSASEPTDELCTDLDRLGEVRWIVVPNRFHHIHAAAFKARYPGARIVGPATAVARNKTVAIDVPIADAHFPDLTPVGLAGVPFLDETLFFHRPTSTLIGADLMMCGCAADHWTWRWTSRLLRQYERFKAPPDVRWKTKPSDEARHSIAQLATLPIERILVAHSDPITERPVEQLRAAWSFVG